MSRVATHGSLSILLWSLGPALALGLATTARAEPHVAIPGTRISLVLPEHFTVSSTFAGIERRDASASIHVVELRAPAEEMKAAFTRRQLASRGMAVLSTESVPSAIGPALLVHVSQTAQGMEFRKWMLVAGSAGGSVLLTATVPRTLADELGEALRSCLVTARWEPGREVDPLEGVGFSVTETADLEIANSIMGSALVLTQGGAQTAIAVGDPFVIVARSTAEVAIADLATFSKRRLNQTAKISNARVESEADAVLGGMPAHELVASAIAEGTLPVVFYQAVAFDGHHYFIVQGRVAKSERDRYLDQFREIARSLSVGK